MPLTRLRAGWGDEFAPLTEPHRGRPFRVVFGVARGPIPSFRTQIERCCENIANEAREPIWVGFSGGIDSEMVCRGLKAVGADFRVVTIAYTGGQNKADIEYARVWCEENKVHQHVLELDIEQFMRDEIPKLAERWKAEAPYQYLQIWMMNRMAGFPVIGGGPIYLRRWRASHTQAQLPGMYHLTTSGVFTPHEYLLQNYRTGVFHFFLHSPELLASWLLDPDVDHFIRTEVGHSNTVMAYFKAYFCQRHYPEMVPRIKLNSFEDTSDAEHRERLAQSNADYLGTARIDYNDMMAMLGV